MGSSLRELIEDYGGDVAIGITKSEVRRGKSRYGGENDITKQQMRRAIMHIKNGKAIGIDGMRLIKNEEKLLVNGCGKCV